MNATIIGAGVMGLSCGVRLLEAGWRVQVLGRELPPHTTSNVAAAMWYPYKAYPEDKVLGWSATTFAEFVRLHTTTPEAGITMVPVVEPLPTPTADPWWQTAVPDFRRLTAAEIPEGFVDGYFFTTPVIDMSIYMAYLLDRYRALGGAIAQKEVTDLAPYQATADVVINCTGLGARDLVGDTAVYPIRGQIVRVKAPAAQRCLLDDHGRYQVSYIIPRLHDVVLGGTAQENNWDLTVDEGTAADIIRKAQAFEPALAGMEILEHKVGLRPGRPSVRLEREETAAGPLIHNYGHGGAGVTLSWGCAAEVLALVGTL